LFTSIRISNPKSWNLSHEPLKYGIWKCRLRLNGQPMWNAIHKIIK
jgi:hypothetical protein